MGKGRREQKAVLITIAPGATAVNTTTAVHSPPPHPAKFSDPWRGLFLTYNAHYHFPQLVLEKKVLFICEKIC